MQWKDIYSHFVLEHKGVQGESGGFSNIIEAVALGLTCNFYLYMKNQDNEDGYTPLPTDLPLRAKIRSVQQNSPGVIVTLEIPNGTLVPPGFKHGKYQVTLSDGGVSSHAVKDHMASMLRDEKITIDDFMREWDYPYE